MPENWRSHLTLSSARVLPPGMCLLACLPFQNPEQALLRSCPWFIPFSSSLKGPVGRQRRGVDPPVAIRRGEGVR